MTLAKNTITAMPQVGDLAVILCGKTSTLKPISDAAVDIAEFRVLCNSSKAFSEYPANPTCNHIINYFLMVFSDTPKNKT